VCIFCWKMQKYPWVNLSLQNLFFFIAFLTLAILIVSSFYNWLLFKSAEWMPCWHSWQNEYFISGYLFHWPVWELNPGLLLTDGQTVRWLCQYHIAVVINGHQMKRWSWGESFFLSGMEIQTRTAGMTVWRKEHYSIAALLPTLHLLCLKKNKTKYSNINVICVLHTSHFILMKWAKSN